MGGYGSTRWGFHSKKDTVDESYSLDANLWMREGVLREGVHTLGSCTWRNSYSGNPTTSIGYEINTMEPGFSWVRLYYTFTQTGKLIDYKIRLTTTRPNFGGLRWWFVCPLVLDGRSCNRRVGKIHLPPFGTYFGCRHCHDLTYTSSQESDTRVSRLRRNPAALREWLDKETEDMSKLIIALKALR